ncbi:MAG: methyltransferase domain-containing protein [Gemmataceae bacterium]
MKETFLFAKQIVKRFRTTGAVAPSGKFLARAMAEAVGEVAIGHTILELGPGTGVFTRELAKTFPQSRIVAVEINDDFAKQIRKTMPSVKVIQACASQLDQHIRELNIEPEDVAAVVSGLPLLSLPKDLGRSILASITRVLRPGRKYVQFTYSERAWRQFDVPGFNREPRRRIWMNVPPAVVLSFVRNETV